eukprot:CAMPEP_0115600758 /NCGR_PEP_ID=MMETSP0272-20121206/15053_1 /TAXON_ID=71861 /ORGANISM="Scrippsiella trochoidea, Strain CCMP3099" /LENGTH=91 /DNA_ID=CAMNT_0003036211 /DNA_START=1092 /DNA_END=1363 /DNA_ORIENTATION=+
MTTSSKPLLKSTPGWRDGGQGAPRKCLQQHRQFLHNWSGPHEVCQRVSRGRGVEQRAKLMETQRSLSCSIPNIVRSASTSSKAKACIIALP